MTQDDEPVPTQPPAPADPIVERIWHDIAWAGSGPLVPRLRLAQQVRSQIEPILLRTLREIGADPETFVSETDYFGQTYALLLLAEFRATAAFPAIIDFLHAIKGYEEALLDQALTDDLPAVLASTFDGNLERLTGLIEDDTLDPQVRGAGLIAMASLVLRGRLDRAILSAQLKRLLTNLPRERDLLWFDVANVISDLKFGEHLSALCAIAEIAGLRHDLGGRREVEQRFQEPSDPLDDRLYRLIDDVVADLKWLPQNAEAVDVVADEALVDGGDLSGSAPEEPEPAPAPYVRVDPKLGRNDPCHCGSGKKYKKCCGS